MVSRLVSGSVVVLGIFLAPAPSPFSRRPSPVACAPHGVHRTFSRRRAAADEDGSGGEFVHALSRGRVERPLGIVRA